jgi:hypothetical protein
VIQRLFARRDPVKDSYANIASALGYKSTGSVTDMLARDDVMVSTLYKLCKYFGYVIVIMKPDDDTGKSDMVINMKKQPLPLMDRTGKTVRGRPRKRKLKTVPKRDRYRNIGGPAPKVAVLQSCLVKNESKAG